MVLSSLNPHTVVASEQLRRRGARLGTLSLTFTSGRGKFLDSDIA